MTSVPSTLSIPDLERLLAEKQQRLEQLIVLREKVQKWIDDLDRKIQDAANPDAPRKQLGKPRFSNAATLKVFVLRVLRKHKKGLLASEITAKVQEAGYRSHSTMFQNVVYQCLYNTAEIEHDPRSGRYSLKGAK